jgi:hypothetical protein
VIITVWLTCTPERPHWAPTVTIALGYEYPALAMVPPNHVAVLD